MMNKNSNTLTRDNALNELKEFYSARGFAGSKVHKISANHPWISQAKIVTPIKITRNIENKTFSPRTKLVFKRIRLTFYSSDKIREYFVYKPSIRAEKVTEYTNYIQSPEDIFKVLQLGNSKEEFLDAYDGAVDLLAECDKDVLSKAFYVAKKNYVSDQSDEVAKSWEKNWDILIQALTCSLTIEPIKKISLILTLYDGRNKLSRLIKLALIDAIVDIDIDEDLSKSILNLFVSEKYESEDFIRKCAKEASESL